METGTDSAADLYLRLAQAFRAPSPESDPEAKAAYARLFLVPGKAAASPYESVHREGRLMGQTAADLPALYAAAGLQLPGHPGELPDHLSVELAFMAHLAGKEVSDPAEAERWRARQRSFLELHLVPWLPSLCRRILTSEAHAFYHPAARLALELMEAESGRLSTSGRSSNSVELAEFIVGAPPASSKLRRFPNMHFEVSASRCTVCTLCADSCKQGALDVRCTASSISLFFSAASCNGCQACVRMCPEGAIRLSRSPALTAPSSAHPRIVHSAARAICPACKQPHIAVPWLDRLRALVPDQGRIQRSLVYCPLCKTEEVEHTPTSAVARQEVCAYD